MSSYKAFRPQPLLVRNLIPVRVNGLQWPRPPKGTEKVGLKARQAKPLAKSPVKVHAAMKPSKRIRHRSLGGSVGGQGPSKKPRVLQELDVNVVPVPKRTPSCNGI